MNYVFSDPLTQKVKSWVLYTENAHHLYKKFGFVPTNEIADFNLLYKLRFQDSLPTYSESINQRFFSNLENSFFTTEETDALLNTKRHMLLGQHIKRST